MRFHWKKAMLMHKGGHHHMKRKLCKKTMRHSMFDEGDMSWKKRFFKRMMKHRSMMGPHHGRWKHYRGHSSSDSDDSGHDHGKRKHLKHMMKHCSPGHHGQSKHSRGKKGYSSSSESEDNDHHHGKKKHFMQRRHRSAFLFGGPGRHFMESRGQACFRAENTPATENNQGSHSGDAQGQGMSSTEKTQCPEGQATFHSGDAQQSKETGCKSSTERGKCSKDIQGKFSEKGHHSKYCSMECSDDDQRCCLSDNGRKHLRKMFKRGGCMTDLEDGYHGRGRHFREMHGRHMFGDAMTDLEDGHHVRGRHFRGMHGRHMFGEHAMTDLEDGHHGRGRHGRHMFGEHAMTDSENHHHGRGRHFRGMHGRHMFGEHAMTDLDDGHHGRERHGRRMFGEHAMTDLEDGHHGRGRHFRGMFGEHRSGDHDKGHKHGRMHHFKGKLWMKRHNKSGCFGEDSALVPICTVDDETPSNTAQVETPENQINDAAETGIDDAACTREQGTQTTAIMEIVIEDQETQNAAISIINKFL